MARPKKPPEEPITPAWFKVWTGWQENIQRLNNEQAGELLKAMMAYSIDGAAPSFTDATLAVYWDFMKNQLAVDRQKYITQVKSNRKAGQISAQNKAKKNLKKPVPKNGVFEAEKADGDSAGQQVLTSVNEEKKKRRGEEPKEPKEKTYKSDLTVSLDKATETDEKFINDNFDVDGYNMANDLWFKNNGRVSLTPKEKSYLRKCISEHGAEFICGCIGELKRRRKAITTETLPAVIKEMRKQAEEEKARAEAEAKQRELEKRSREALVNAIAEIKQAFVDVGEDRAGNDFDYFFRNANDFGAQVMTLLQDDNFAHNGIYHVELAREIIKDLKKNNNPTNIHLLLAELEKRKGAEKE